MTITRHLLDSPHNCMYGIFNDLQGVRALSERLLSLGLENAQVRVLVGEEGVREMDHDGRHHGLLARLRRMVQGITDERGHVQEYAWALNRGRVVVMVQLPARTGLAPVCAAFKACGAHFVHHYGAWVVHQLSA